jgi:hypothetical protein
MFFGHSQTNVIDYVTIATLGNAIDFGDLTNTPYINRGLSSAVRVLSVGGANPTNVICYMTIATLGNATDFGDLTSGRGSTYTSSSGVRGVIAGGYLGSAVYNNVIDYVTIATTGNAVDFGDISSDRGGAGTGSLTRGILPGAGGPSSINTIEYLTIATAGNSVDFGDLTVARTNTTALSDSHGGLAAAWPKSTKVISYKPAYSTLLTTYSPAQFQGTAVTRNFTSESNSLLVLVILTIPNNNGPTPDPTVTGGGLTWTQQARYQGGGAYGLNSLIYTAPVTTGASMNASVVFSEQQEWQGLAVYGVTNYNVASPVGGTLATGGGSRSGAWRNYLSSTPSPTSIIIGGVCGDSGLTITPGPSWRNDGVVPPSGILPTMVRKIDSISELNFSTITCSISWACAFIEIKAA